MAFCAEQRIQRFAVIVLFIFLFISDNALAAIQCYDCHGTRNPVDYRPVDAPYRNITTGGFPGNHRSHVAVPGTPAACEPCHPGSSSYTIYHRDGAIKVSANINNSPAPARYKNMTSAFPQNPGPPSLGTCSNVNCHFEASSPTWGSAPFSGANDCGKCHGLPPADGSHPAHDSYYGPGTASCGKCHVDHMSETAPFAHATSAGKRGLVLQGVTYSKTANTNYPNYLPSRTLPDNRNGFCTNVSCHQGVNAIWGSTVDHAAALGSGVVVVFNGDNPDHGIDFGIEENCTLCHYANLKTQHANNCALCHSGGNPAGGLIGTWNKTCQQGSCHPSIHAAMGADHNGIYWNSSSSCALCHDTNGGSFPGPGDNCSRCHSPDLTAAAVGDHQPPTTTSNALGVYVGPSSIHLTATDVGSSGVSLTRYSLDGKTWKLGNDVYFSAPASGSKVHTLQFYSADHAMNIEAVKTITFTVQATAVETTPPTTTSSFNPAAGAIFNANQPVTLTAVDNPGGTGVMATNYRIDSGAFTTGTTFTVSGDGLHTFSYYSVNNAGNTEATHVSNFFRIDTVAPVTTCSAMNGSNYTGAQTFTLTPSDAGGSGVAGTWYQLDAGAWTAGTLVTVLAPGSGTAPHTISWYSRDNANNQETIKSVTFTVQADLTPPTTTSNFNPTEGAIFNAIQPVTLTAIDNSGGTGIMATYYRIDSGAFTAGTTFTVSGDGLHTFSYYSVDNTGNTEATHVSNSFRIDTVAPTTTCSAVNGSNYTGAQTFTLTPSDAGGSGVVGTWYQLDAGAWIAGTTVTVPAPGSGTASHTISWYSRDNANNQETTKSVTFTIQPAGATGTTTLSFRISGISGWSSAYWAVLDAGGNVIAEYWNDDGGGHPESLWWDFVVPSGYAYTMAGEVGPEPDGPWPRETRSVSPAEATPGATIVWWY